MPVIRFRAILGIFFVTCLALVCFSIELDLGFFSPKDINGGQKESETVSVFSDVDYYYVRELAPHFFLKANELSMDSEHALNLITKPQGTFFLEGGRPFHFTSNTGKADQKKQIIYLDGEAHIFDKDSQIFSEKATFFAKENKFEAFGNVRSQNISPLNGDEMHVDSLEAKFWPKDRIAHYLGQVKGSIKRKLAYEDGVDFSTDRLFAYLNDSEVTLDGQVTLIRKQFHATSLKAKIFLENYNKKLKYYALYDDVKILEKVSLKGGKVLERKAFGENLEGHMKERKVVLTGSPKVIQGKDVIKGNKITLIENNEVIEVDDSNSRLLIKEATK